VVAVRVLRALWNWWCGEWDYLFIITSYIIIALLVGGAVSATIEAVQRATVYH